MGPARDDCLATFGMSGERKQDPRGIVVRDERGLAAGQGFQQVFDDRRSPSSAAVLSAYGDVAETGGRFRNRVDRFGGQRTPPHPGVNDNTGRVDRFR